MKSKKIFLAAVMTVAFGKVAGSHELLPGFYEIKYSVGLPNVSGSLVKGTVRRCITAEEIEAHNSFRIESKNPLTKCPISPVCSGGNKSGFYIECTGRGAAKAIGRFEMFTTSFRGKIEMNMGGKNMTVTESQKGVRLRECSNSERSQ